MYLKFPFLSKPEIVAGCPILGVNSIMGGGLSRFIRLRKAAAAALIFCLLAVFFLSFLTISAMAGTETGEFCPTCPDWTNLDGWLAQKEAYEQAQQSGQQSVARHLASKTDRQATSQPLPKPLLRKRAMLCPSLSPAPHPSRAIRLFWM